MNWPRARIKILSLLVAMIWYGDEASRHTRDHKSMWLSLLPTLVELELATRLIGHLPEFA